MTKKLTIACPGCGAKLNMTEEALGQTLSCPRCGRGFRVRPRDNPASEPDSVAVINPEKSAKGFGSFGDGTAAPATAVAKVSGSSITHLPTAAMGVAGGVGPANTPTGPRERLGSPRLLPTQGGPPASSTLAGGPFGSSQVDSLALTGVTPPTAPPSGTPTPAPANLPTGLPTEEAVLCEEDEDIPTAEMAGTHPFGTCVVTQDSTQPLTHGITSPTPLGADVLRSEDLNDPLIGRVLGGYRLVRVLGRGGRGVVYVGEDVMLGRPAAIKLLAPQVVAAEPAAADRFLLEARASAKLDHPNIVGIYAVGRDGDLVFTAMALVKGRSLDAVIAETASDSPTAGPFSEYVINEEAAAQPRGLPPAEATRIVRQAAKGLAAAHAAGVIHRDVKPANILLGDDGAVKVADFGLARMLDEVFSRLTAFGKAVGTPQYMAPEQCRGLETDARADIYSLGATYFHLLTGRAPFEGNTPTIIAQQQVNDRHPDPRSLRADIPAACVAIIDRSMAKLPNERYRSMAEMATALKAVEEKLLRDELEARPIPPAPQGVSFHQATSSTVVLDEQAIMDMLGGDDDHDSREGLSALMAPPPGSSSRHGPLRAGSSANNALASGSSGSGRTVSSPGGSRSNLPGDLTGSGASQTGSMSGRMPITRGGPPAVDSSSRQGIRPPTPGSQSGIRKAGYPAPISQAEPQPEPPDTPVAISFRLRFADVPAAKAGLASLPDELRAAARKVIAPVTAGSREVHLDISLDMPPQMGLMLVRTMMLAGGRFVSLNTPSLRVGAWLSAGISASA